MNINPAHCIDFYKSGHAEQYPTGTMGIYSNFTPRSDTHAKVSKLFDHKVVFFGLQGFCKWFLVDLWNEQFFRKDKDVVINAFKRRMDNALGKGSVSTDRLAALHDLGYLPISIKALPEGSRVNIKVPLFTVINTDAEFFWLTNYIETVLSNECWKPTTIATIAFEYRRVMDAFVELTGSSPEFADWQIHDFSMRGVSGVSDAHSANAGHLLSNYGTDTVVAIDYLENYYFADSDKELIGGSVPATEHSVMCAGGDDSEVETIRRLIEDVYPSGIVSVVSDTWDFWNVITETAKILKPAIINRKLNELGQAKVVFRPDSGDPADIICGTTYGVDDLDWKSIIVIENMIGELPRTVECKGKYYRIPEHPDMHEELTFTEYEPTPQEKGAVSCLWDTFGGDITAKGYRTLSQRVGLIYGDSITLERQWDILSRLAKKGFSAGNLVFGVGSYTYQMITRDTFGMAMKATGALINGEFLELFKDPKTDIGGVKKSAKGLLRVVKEGNDFVLLDQQTEQQESLGELKLVFDNSRLYNTQTLSQIRARLKDSKALDIITLE